MLIILLNIVILFISTRPFFFINSKSKYKKDKKSKEIL